MKYASRAAIAFGVAALLAGGVIAACTSAGAEAGGETIHVHELVSKLTYVPVQTLTASKSAVNQGDLIAFDDPVVNAATSKTVGYNEGACFLTDVAASLYECPAVTFVFTGTGGYRAGTIVATGYVDSPASGSGKVTMSPLIGGTGAYSGAKGTLEFQQLTPTLDSEIFTLKS